MAPQPLYLLPLLRAGALSALLTREAPDLDWVGHFGMQMLSLEQVTGARTGQRGDRNELSVQPEPKLASYARSNPRLLAALAGVEANVLAEAGSDASALPKDKIEMREWFQRLKVPVAASTVVESGGLRDAAATVGPYFRCPASEGQRWQWNISDHNKVTFLPCRPVPGGLSASTPGTRWSTSMASSPPRGERWCSGRPCN